MLVQYKRKTNVGIGLGLLTSIVGTLVGNSLGCGRVEPPILLRSLRAIANCAQSKPVGLLLLIGGSLLQLIGIVLFLWGCWSYAKGKGYRGAWGLLGLGFVIAGLPGLIGLIILAVFPDISAVEAATALGEPTPPRKISWGDYDFWAVVLSVLGLAALPLAFWVCSIPIYLVALATEVAAMVVGFYGLQTSSTRPGAEVGLLVAVLVLLAGFFGFILFYMKCSGGNLL